jgi:hypothetical protein
MSGTDMKLYKECTGRDDLPNGGLREAWLICGRRAGKSFVRRCLQACLAVSAKYFRGFRARRREKFVRWRAAPEGRAGPATGAGFRGLRGIWGVGYL